MSASLSVAMDINQRDEPVFVSSSCKHEVSTTHSDQQHSSMTSIESLSLRQASNNGLPIPCDAIYQFSLIITWVTSSHVVFVLRERHCMESFQRELLPVDNSVIYHHQ